MGYIELNANTKRGLSLRVIASYMFMYGETGTITATSRERLPECGLSSVCRLLTILLLITVFFTRPPSA